MRTDRVLIRTAWIAVLALILGAVPASTQSLTSPDPITPAIVDANGQPLRASVASLEPVALGHSRQFLLIRGHDVWNPVLIYIGGAPGESHLALNPKFNAELEKHFIVVTWEPRNVGKSYVGQAAGPVFIDQYVQDTIELAGMMKDRFRQQQVFLVGHGFGAVVGALAVQQHPELFQAFVAISPMVSPGDNEQQEFEFASEMAQRLNDTAAQVQLKTLGHPPYSGKDMVQQYRILHELSTRFAQQSYPVNEYRRSRAQAVADAQELSAVERSQLPAAETAMYSQLYPQLLRVNLAEEVPALAVPVYFMAGRHDIALSSGKIAEAYFNQLKAPVKGFYWFDASGSAPQFEEPDKFVQVMISRVLADSTKRRNVTD